VRRPAVASRPGGDRAIVYDLRDVSDVRYEQGEIPFENRKGQRIVNDVGRLWRALEEAPAEVGWAAPAFARAASPVIPNSWRGRWQTWWRLGGAGAGVTSKERVSTGKHL
jgi:hypothetical protein